MRKAIDLSPESEPISMNFFHVLWEQDKDDMAFEEIKRFVKLTGFNAAYGEIVQGIRLQLN